MDELMNYLFSEAGDEHVYAATPFFELLEANYDTEIIAEGEEGNTALFIIVDGDVEVKRDGVGLGTLHSGSMVGELCLFGQERRTASVTANTPVRLLAIDREGFQHLQGLGNRVTWILEIRALATVVRRLRDTQLRIAQIAEQRGGEIEIPEPTFMEWVRSSLAFWGRGVGGTNERARLLSSLPTFENVEESALHEVAKAMHGRKFKQGEYICREGDDADEVYLIVDGQVDVFGSGESELVATLGNGEFFGVSSMLDDQPRNATCSARTEELVLLILDRRHWQSFADASTQAASSLRCAMLKALAHQLDRANAQLVKIDAEQREQMRSKWAEEAKAPARDSIHDLIFKR